MITKYQVYWVDENGNHCNEKYLNDFHEALHCFLYLSKKHDRVYLIQHLSEEDTKGVE